MDREEAIKIIDCYDIGFYDLSGEKIPADKLADAFDMAIEALSAEPTELLDDGTLKVNVQNGAEINRVLVWGDDGCGGLYYADDRPSGEWIFNGDGKEQRKSWFICDQCGQSLFHKTNYCPNCGAKMGGNK